MAGRNPSRSTGRCRPRHTPADTAGRRASYTVAKGGVVSLGEAFAYRGSELAQAAVTGTSVTAPYTDTYAYNAQGGPLELIRQQQGGATARYWYVLDGRGSVVALTDSTGSVVDRYGYDAWGQATSVSEQAPQPFRYAGYWWDAALGWYWLEARSYDPQLERFLQPDPSGEDGARSYAYAGDDPLDLTDPSGFGLCEAPLLGGVACATGTVLHGAWQFVAGDDIQTVSDPNASLGVKALAPIDLGSNAILPIPAVGEGVEGVKFGVKGVLYLGRKIVQRELTRAKVTAIRKDGYCLARPAPPPAHPPQAGVAVLPGVVPL